MFHKVRKVSALPEHLLKVQFDEGETKIYDVSILFDRLPEFRALQDPEIFNKVTVDIGGYGVIWNDNLDLSSDELWENGILQTNPSTP